MARSRLVDPSVDLVSDGGSVLFSFVKGEQLEFPVTLSFLDSTIGSTPGTFTGSITNNVLTVTALSSGTVMPGQLLSGTGVSANTYITGYITGIGGLGTYSIAVYPPGGTAQSSPTVTSTIINGALNSYTYETTVVEALNTTEQSSPPTAIKPNASPTVLAVRVPINRGTWASGTTYNVEDVVFHAGKYYKQNNGFQGQSSTTVPASDAARWTETASNRVYVQFPKTLGSTWTQQATVTASVYGFFELRVTENASIVYPRTWKPVRGLVEILYSPTYSADD
jgi:hypothetical protein